MSDVIILQPAYDEAGHTHAPSTAIPGYEISRQHTLWKSTFVVLENPFATRAS